MRPWGLGMGGKFTLSVEGPASFLRGCLESLFIFAGFDVLATVIEEPLVSCFKPPLLGRDVTADKFPGFGLPLLFVGFLEDMAAFLGFIGANVLFVLSLLVVAVCFALSGGAVVKIVFFLVLAGVTIFLLMNSDEVRCVFTFGGAVFLMLA